jgi:hypothetical protein
MKPLALALVFFAAPSIAQAEEPASGESGDVLVLEELLVEGTIETPDAFYILNRARLGDDVLELRTSFLPAVIESANGDIF